MTIYRIISTLPVAAGTIVQLDAVQAANRAHRIESLGEGRYCLKELLQFKRGEVVGIEGELPKIHLDCVEVESAPVSGNEPAPISKHEPAPTSGHGSASVSRHKHAQAGHRNKNNRFLS